MRHLRIHPTLMFETIKILEKNIIRAETIYLKLSPTSHQVSKTGLYTNLNKSYKLKHHIDKTILNIKNVT